VLRTFVLVLLLLFTSISLVTANDEYSQYLGMNVTVQECNVTVWQGIMTQWFEDSIVIKEMCNPEFGDVTVKKSCIVWIHDGYECLKV
jgi:hypothetical protein